MRNGVLCLLSSLVFAAPISAETDRLYLGASYLDNDSKFSGYSDHVSGFELSVGYSLSQHFAAEVSYLDLGTLHLPDGPDSGGDIDNDGFALQFVAEYPIDRFTVYGKLGNLWWSRDGVLASIGGPVKFGSDGSDLIYGIGFGYDVTDHVDVRLEYRGSDIDHDSNLASLGLSYRF